MTTPRKPLPDHAVAAIEDAQADVSAALRVADGLLARPFAADVEAELARLARRLERALRRLGEVRRPA